MFYKSLVFISIIILLLSLTSTYSDPLIEQDLGSFTCNGTNQTCCPQLAHRIASIHHSQCASIVLINKSGYNMTLSVANLEDGRWVTPDDYENTNCEPHSLLNDQSEAFSSVTSHFLGGVHGFAIFSMDDDISSSFTISWEAPVFGPRKFSFDWLTKESEYKVERRKQFGDTVLEVTIYQDSWSILYMIPVPFFLIPCCCIIKANPPRERLTSNPQQSYNSFESVFPPNPPLVSKPKYDPQYHQYHQYHQ